MRKTIVCRCEDVTAADVAHALALGYGDIVMSRERRLLGPFEAVNGMLMLGMSAATLTAIVQHMITLLRDARVDAGRGSQP